MNNQKGSSLEELLVLSNADIMATRGRFSEVVWKYEGGEWNDAQRKAAELTRTNTAWNYLDEIRTRLGITPLAPVPSPVEQAAQPAKENKEIPVAQENFQLLNEFAPELAADLAAFEPGTRLKGTSAVNIYGTASLAVDEKDKFGYYLTLEVSESSKPSTKVRLYYDTAKQTVLPLSIEDDKNKLEVYNDPKTKEMVNLYQQETQDQFLNGKLKKFIGVKLSIGSFETEQQPAEEQEPEIDFSSWDLSDLERQRTWLPMELDDDAEELKEQVGELEEQVTELEKENEQLKAAAMNAVFASNMRLFEGLIPSLKQELELESFTVLFHAPQSEQPEFKMVFDMDNKEACCAIYESNPADQGEGLLMVVALEPAKAMFFFNPKEFSDFDRKYHFMMWKEYSAEALHANTVLGNWLQMLMDKGYRAVISERVHKAEINASPTEEIAAKEVTEESDGTGTVLALLGVGLAAFLGIRFLKP